MNIRLVAKLVTLNDLERHNGRYFCVISANSVAFGVDPVVDRVKRTDRLGCFVDRLHRLVDDFTTRLDLDDFRST